MFSRPIPLALAQNWREIGAELVQKSNPKVRPAMPDTQSDLLRYSILKAPAGCLEVVLACAADGQPHAQVLLRHGLIAAIAQDPRLERRLWRSLCIEALPIHGLAIVKDYLAGLSPPHHERLFATSALQDKHHPVNHLFSQASFKTAKGALALALLDTFVAVGLQGERLQALALRRHQDVLRACSLGNATFLVFLSRHLQPLPVKLLTYVVGNETHSSELVVALLTSGQMTLENFLSPKVRRCASPAAMEMLSALEARATRQISG